MHNALAHPRLHHAKARIIGIYAPDGSAPTATTERGEQDSSAPKRATAAIHADACVYVPNPRGQHFKTIGRADSRGREWLLPEEALYLLERGSLDIRWPCALTGEEGDGASELPMSLQAAYACLIGRGGLTVERYSVYSGLRRLGYVIIRAPGWYEQSGDSAAPAGERAAIQRGPEIGLFTRFWQWFYSSNSTATGPVIGLGIHRSYSEWFLSVDCFRLLTLLDDIYRKLALVPWYDPAAPRTAPTSPPFRVVFHIYKPSTAFKKSAQPPPDFRVAVVDARKHPTIPASSDLGALLESTPLDPPRGEKMDRLLYMRLKHGYRNVILAVVDQGVVSYLRVSDSAFGKEKIYDKVALNAGKGRPRGKPTGR